MIKVKDGYAKLIGTTFLGSANRVLLSNGGDFGIHTGRNNEANKLVRTDASGYIQAGWINTTSGNFTGTPTRIYASNDEYIRYMTPANFFSTLANDSNQVSITVAGQNRKLTVAYATSANSANSATSISSWDVASSSDVKRRIWISYSDNSGKACYTDNFTYQTSTNTLFAPHLNGKIVIGGGSYSWYQVQQFNSSNTNPSYYSSDCAVININSYTGWQPWIRGVDSENGSWTIGQYTTCLHIGYIPKTNTTNALTYRWDFNKDGSSILPGQATINGTVRIVPNLGSYQEGIRIQPKDSWATFMLLGTDTTAATSGTSAKSWGFFNNDGTLYINKNSSSAAGNPRAMATSTGWTFGNTSLNSYALNAASFICASWVRTKGSTGWYNEDYGGGWYMTDSTYVRVYNDKRVYNSNTSQYAFYTAGGMTASGNIYAARFVVTTANAYRDSGGIILSNADIWGLNAIYTADLADGAGEGYQFKRSNSNYDSIWCSDGTFYFSPNGHPDSGYGTNYTVYHSGNLSKSTLGLGNVQNTAFYKRTTTVNGTAWSMAGTNSDAAFTIYAPTTAGTSGQVLTSSGGTPSWTNQSSLSVGYATTAGTANSVAWANVTGKPTIPSFAAKGSATQGVYLSGTNTFATMTHSLNATVNAGYGGNLAYYSGTTTVGPYTSTIGGNSRLMYLNAGVPTNSTANVGLSHWPTYLSNGSVKQCAYKYHGYVTWGTNCSGSICVYQFGPVVFLQGYITKVNNTNGATVFTIPSSAPGPAFSVGWPLVQANGADNDRNTIIRMNSGTTARSAYVATNYTEVNPNGSTHYISWVYMTGSTT